MARKHHHDEPEDDFIDTAPEADYGDEEEVDIISKSQLKRDSEALQALGVALIDVPTSALAKLDLPEELVSAIKLAQKITSNSAIKRQRQYIGKLMRQIDPAPIQALLADLRGDNDRKTAWLHQVERTRDELLADDKGVAELINTFPHIDIQQLRQLVRNARAERAAQKPPKHYRALFQFIKTLYPEPSLVPESEAADEEADEDKA
ncbi:ribosome biogenesis factor YjgA [Chitinimonas sp. BJYL2]|uniref:ribosome biogenesis factor YjgA n=1 Tax=Chitinimonas sp. BJYL2 TaxID=2976696 RepID=UPI0022B355E9|nr:ribosome biogenesis factor YjgA [Chitinimonas sp. BJYL2]